MKQFLFTTCLVSVALLPAFFCGSEKKKTSKPKDTYGTPIATSDIPGARQSPILADSYPDQGAIGDVKYSILKPEDFIKVNGDGWELLKGQKIEPDGNKFDPLIYSNEKDYIPDGANFKLPDARGVFLRGLDKNKANAQGNDETSARLNGYKIGEYEADLLPLPQDGPIQLEYIKFIPSFGGGPQTIGELMTIGSAKDQYGQIKLTKPTLNKMGEVRPRSISIFIYVKLRNSNAPK